MKNSEELDRFLETLTHEQEHRFWQIRVSNSLLSQVRLREDVSFYLTLGTAPSVAPALAAEWVHVRRELENLIDVLAQGAGEYTRANPWDIQDPNSLPHDIWRYMTRKLDRNEPDFQDLDLFKSLFGRIIGYYSGLAQNDMDRYEEEWRRYTQNESDYDNWLNQFESPTPEERGIAGGQP